jgi:hypothetical protein
MQVQADYWGAHDMVPVTVDNFVRAETDMYLAVAVKLGAFGKFEHRRELVAIAKQTVAFGNRDALSSSAVFDLEAAPVTITMPDAGTRYMVLEVIDQDHYVHAFAYGPGRHTFTREQIGTRYAIVGVRTFVDPLIAQDVLEAHRLQDAVAVTQKHRGRFEAPNWDHTSQKHVRDVLAQLGAMLPDSRRMFGARHEVDPVRHLIGTATAWGGNPEREAVYCKVTPRRNDGIIVYRLRVADVPVDAFWSISVYNAEGLFEHNPRGAYTVNSITAKREPDGSVEVQFGGCDSTAPNCLPIMRGWNYMVRLYRPRAEALDGRWTFPEAQPVR